MACSVMVMALTEQAEQALALIAREAMDEGDISHNNLWSWLADAVRRDRPDNSWCYFIDFQGDGESGMVQFCCDGCGTMEAPYAISQVDGGVSVKIDMASAVEVLQTTTYQRVADPEAYAAMESAKLYTHGSCPLVEREITKDMRDKAAASSFAGKGKSFPILKAGDVKAALSSIGRAGAGNHPAATLKANILRIAKAKGFPIPDSDKEDAKEAARVKEAGARHSKTDQSLIQTIHDHSIALGADPAASEDDDELGEASKGVQAMHDKAVTGKKQKQHDTAVDMGASCGKDCPMGAKADESAAFDIVGDVIPLREGAVGQDGTAYLKLIQPGWGSCGYYPAEVLERDGPKIFKSGTKGFWDHQTAAEEAARPEGSLRDLASVLTEDAHYEANGPAGAGLYARANVFEQFRAPVDSLAKHIGMSIRASGTAKEGKAPDGKSGKIIEKLTHGLSVDYVTTPGAGGQILQLFEAARGRVAQPQPPVAESAQENEMEAAALQKLQESVTALAADNRKLRERQAVTDAGGAIAEYFRTVQVSEAIKGRITGRVLAGTIPMTEAGDLDSKKVKEFAESQLNDELAFLGRLNPGLVVNMGARSVGQMTEAQREEAKERKAAEKEALKESDGRFMSLLGFSDERETKGRKILIEGRRAFDVNYNSRNRGAVAQSGQSIGLEA